MQLSPVGTVVNDLVITQRVQPEAFKTGETLTEIEQSGQIVSSTQGAFNRVPASLCFLADGFSTATKAIR